MTCEVCKERETIGVIAEIDPYRAPVATWTSGNMLGGENEKVKYTHVCRPCADNLQMANKLEKFTSNSDLLRKILIYP